MNLGKLGEEIAVSYLKKRGYKIIETNFSCKFGEIDIIAEKDDTICFIEVKTRTNESFGSPIEAITPFKMKHIIKSVQYYILKRHLEDKEVRLDVLEVEMIDGRANVNQIENAIWL
ncbi:MAG: YraN family protein [Clostridiales bacterium]|nr:YraN family protein [Clostridiales bacterium]